MAGMRRSYRKGGRCHSVRSSPPTDSHIHIGAFPQASPQHTTYPQCCYVADYVMLLLYHLCKLNGPANDNSIRADVIVLRMVRLTL